MEAKSIMKKMKDARDDQYISHLIAFESLLSITIEKYVNYLTHSFKLNYESK